MITIHNRQLRENVPFDEYVQLPFYSHSDIKNDGRAFTSPTTKMLIGTDVHNYLSEPEKYNHDNVEIVRPAAVALKQIVGPLWKYGKPELVVTCWMRYNGFQLPYKGRGDRVIVDRLVVDFKISSMPIKSGIDRFGYDDQLSGYGIGFGASAAIIIRVDPKTCVPGKKPLTEIYNVPIKHDWWCYQIMHRGKPY